ncbi:hypothetical protein SAMN05192545_3921 [Maribacter dokdonensis]|uniref:Uncharacterized protein n=1 Tax=Maribacter dokdonensis TaxID=320912 RepID=A0ABY0V0R4_9FLAO|nr:hypothetical protein [Maribacter dokdonensis]SDT47095.1 hypothetical protein SAMN05192545_3921 [Maribacter dokdonensis]
MTPATITKTLNKLNSNLEETHGKLTTGAKRYFVLPTRVRRAVDLAIYLETKNVNTWNAKIEFFKNMTEKEYLNYLKQA